MQSTVYTQVPVGVVGGFCTANPHYTAVTPVDGYGFIAGSAGVYAGRFAWVDGTDSRKLNSTGSGAPAGIVLNDRSGVITTWMAGSSLVFVSGLPVILVSDADLWVLNAGSGAVTRGQKAFAKLSDGTVAFAAAGASVSGYVETGWYATNAAAVGELVAITKHF